MSSFAIAKADRVYSLHSPGSWFTRDFTFAAPPPKGRRFMVSTRMDGKIEGLEKTMEDVQGDIVQMKDFLGQLQSWMKKKDEMDTEILR
ncbi:hypothetical protein V6N11_026067 [Hibiscus sabdariffa]|uniref:Uncharacterized protein n=1 Tax=Hibiscus sabdariffa TaxID=183260 RepID=A0ABR2SUK2_9ROSI